MIAALQTNSMSAYAYVTFIANMAPVCESNMSIVPSTGLALNTYFDFSIDSCADPDLDFPLIYRFNIITENSVSYIVSSANQLNSISTKMFEGYLIGNVSVCDQLSGCISYANNLTVVFSRIRRLSTSDALLKEYDADTSNIELIPLYSIAYLKTYNLTADEIAYIFNDVLSNYINSRNIITSEIIEIFLSLINQILSNTQQESLVYNIVQMYLEEIINLAESSTDQLSSDNIDLVFSISEKILTIGNFTFEYIQLVDNFINILIADYSLEMLPGIVIADSQVNDALYYYKERALSLDYMNTAIKFTNGTQIKIAKLLFNPEAIVNIIVSIYPQSNDFSSIIAVNFTSSGTFFNQKLNITSEQEIS